MHFSSKLASACALVVLAACNSTGGSSPTPPTPTATPSVSQTITAGITASASLSQAVNGPDGRVWFSEFNTSGVAAVTTTGTATEYAMPVGSQPNGITVGADSNIWTGGYGGVILKVTTAGVATSYPIAGAHIGGLVLGPDGNVWYTDYGNKTVGKITTAGVITTYTPPAGVGPSEITKGPDNNLWVTDFNGSILQVTPAGVFTQFKTGLSAGASPNAIVTGSDGNLYFTEPFFSATKNDHIGKITTAGVITELGSLAPNTYPNQITTGKDGNLYFSQYATGMIGKVTVSSGTVSEWTLGIVNGGGIVNGPDNNLWVGGQQAVYKISY